MIHRIEMVQVVAIGKYEAVCLYEGEKEDEAERIQLEYARKEWVTEVIHYEDGRPDGHIIASQASYEERVSYLVEGIYSDRMGVRWGRLLAKMGTIPEWFVTVEQDVVTVWVPSMQSTHRFTRSEYAKCKRFYDGWPKHAGYDRLHGALASIGVGMDSYDLAMWSVQLSENFNLDGWFVVQRGVGVLFVAANEQTALDWVRTQDPSVDSPFQVGTWDSLYHAEEDWIRELHVWLREQIFALGRPKLEPEGRVYVRMKLGWGYDGDALRLTRRVTERYSGAWCYAYRPRNDWICSLPEQADKAFFDALVDGCYVRSWELASLEEIAC